MSAPSEPLPFSALLLAGGKSRRMGMDKANLRYADNGIPQWKRMAALLGKVCPRVCISIRHGQALEDYSASDGELIEDGAVSMGPLTGLLAAFAKVPETAWLVVACDLPLLDFRVLDHLATHRGLASAIAYKSANDSLPEPLCAIYERSFLPVLQQAMDNGMLCPRKILIQNHTKVALLDLPFPEALENANTPEEFDRLRNHPTQASS